MSNIASLFRRCGAGAEKASDLREEMRGHLEQLPDDEVLFFLNLFFTSMYNPHAAALVSRINSTFSSKKSQLPPPIERSYTANIDDICGPDVSSSDEDEDADFSQFMDPTPVSPSERQVMDRAVQAVNEKRLGTDRRIIRPPQ